MSMEYAFEYYQEDGSSTFLPAGYDEDGRTFVRAYENDEQRGSLFEIRQREVGPWEDLTTA